MPLARHVIISIHAPPRGATIRNGRCTWCKEFQFTPLREGRRARSCEGFAAPKFQFTPLREGRRGRRGGSGRGEGFQFTPLREGRPAPTTIKEEPLYFNSRPSARGDRNGQHRPRRPCISIHAPPRGATLSGSVSGASITAFQFTPLREGRRLDKAYTHLDNDFNSRPSARGDGFPSVVRIHSP